MPKDMTANRHTLTLTNEDTGELVSLPADTSRGYGVSASEPGAVRLIGAINPVVPVAAVILLKADGSWHHVHTEYGYNNNAYYHFDYAPVRFDSASGEHREDLPQPTNDQRRTLARWFFQGESPYGISPGHPVMVWAFGNSSMEEVATHYGYEPHPLA